jgi:hypothetical protein
VRASREEPKKPDDVTLLGVGFDAEDGQTRLTRGENFGLVGGSEETHSIMQESAIKINEHADRKGKRLADVSVDEMRDICQEVTESHGKPD